MGKSSKKSASKVESAPAVIKESKPLKKGKREPEDELETKVNLKKQKVAAVPAKKLPKKVESSDSDSSDSEEEVKAKKVPAKKVVAKADSSSSDDDSSSDDEPAQKKAPATNGAVAKKSKDDSSSDDDSSDEEEVAATKKPAAAKNGSVKAKEESSSDEDESSSDEEPAKKPAAAVAKPAAKDSSSSEEDSDDESSEDEKKPVAKKAAPAKAASSSSSDEDSDEESEDEKPAAKKAKAAPAKKESDSDESSDDSEEESEEEKETPKKKSADVEMVDAEEKSAAKQPKTPSTPAAGGCKTLFAGNLSFNIERTDVEEFFKEVGEVVDVRFATDRENGNFRGFGHVEFATAEQAQKGLKLVGQHLLGREIRLDMAQERGERPAYTPQSSNARSTGGAGDDKQTIFVKGFDSSQSEDDIKHVLSEHFAQCGAVTRVSVPIDRETGASKGIAYIDFQEHSEKEKAFELDGSDLGGYSLKVDEPRPRADSSAGGGYNSGRGSGRFNGGGRDGRGRSSRGRDSRGRGRDTRGRGRPSFSSQGKKTTFGDDYE